MIHLHFCLSYIALVHGAGSPVPTAQRRPRLKAVPNPMGLKHKDQDPTVLNNLVPKYEQEVHAIAPSWGNDLKALLAYILEETSRQQYPGIVLKGSAAISIWNEFYKQKGNANGLSELSENVREHIPDDIDFLAAFDFDTNNKLSPSKGSSDVQTWIIDNGNPVKLDWHKIESAEFQNRKRKPLIEFFKHATESNLQVLELLEILNDYAEHYRGVEKDGAKTNMLVKLVNRAIECNDLDGGDVELSKRYDKLQKATMKEADKTIEDIQGLLEELRRMNNIPGNVTESTPIPKQNSKSSHQEMETPLDAELKLPREAANASLCRKLFKI